MPATDQMIHALAACPDCGSITRTRDVIDLPPPRIIVTAHVYLERHCSDCGKRCVPRPQVQGVVTGPGRAGHRLTSLLGVLREETRIPIRGIQRLLATLTGRQLSVLGDHRRHRADRPARHAHADRHPGGDPGQSGGSSRRDRREGGGPQRGCLDRQDA